MDIGINTKVERIAEQLERIADALEKQNAGNLVVKVDSEPVCQASSDEMESMSTSKLVEELKKRDGVSVITADPHEEYSVSTSQCGFRDTGPAVILVIRD